MAKDTGKLTVETLTHDGATRKNIPTAEYRSVVEKTVQAPIRVAYDRRNRDLDPQLMWRGKDEQDWSDLVVHAPPLYVQEKVHPKVLIDDLLRQAQENKRLAAGQIDLFADCNGLPTEEARTEFYQHGAHWTNRMILGDSLQVMASLAEREGLRGKVQCIYIDPPYGIKFNSNFQWSTLNREVKDGKLDHITREPEQVRAFRDTWKDGINSYLTYLRDRILGSRDLLSETGCIFVQIGEENAHLIRSLLDEVFGPTNFVADIIFRKKTMPLGAKFMDCMIDHIILYARDVDKMKYRQLFWLQDVQGDFHWKWWEDSSGVSQMSREQLFNHSHLPADARIFRTVSMKAPGYSPDNDFSVDAGGSEFPPPKGGSWITGPVGMDRLIKAGRVYIEGRTPTFKLFLKDFPLAKLTSLWSDAVGAFGKVYVVQTNEEVVKRCLLMASDPGDLVLDPTCGSGTTAYVAEQWGRRWITIDTSRVALALARARIMGARYPYHLLADSRDGQLKEAEIARTAPSSQPTRGDIRQGFVYERVPHITLKSIANNAEIDVIWEKFAKTLEPLREQLNAALGKNWQEWEIRRDTDDKWPEPAKELHAEWWKQRIARQQEIDASIAAKAEFESLRDKPYADKKKVRVAGPFTVESSSPHRVLAVAENDDLIDPAARSGEGPADVRNFVDIILDNLKTAGVQQAHKEDKITFTALTPWPGDLICAEGRYCEGGGDSVTEKRAAIFIGPEFGTVSRPDLVEAAREASDAGCDVLIACAFNYDALSSEFGKLGRIPVLKARMNADLHMAEDLKNTGKGNLFVVFGEPDIDILPGRDGQIQVKINGVDVFHPNTGEVRSNGAEGIACWFIDTDYDEECFFVRHAYFLGANDPYKALKTTLKAEIDADAWATLNSDTSRPFDKPGSGRIAVKVINHLGDEVMKVFKVS